MAATAARTARRLEVHGTVQGVGFRPFVFRLATLLGIEGTVRNAGGRVIIDAAGPARRLDEFARRLRTDAPPLARVSRVAASPLDDAPARGSGFRIDVSTPLAPALSELPPDVATCDDCLRELGDPADRRHRYPFTNCTNCGPRATVIDDLPYDRSRTTMRGFALCADCAREYGDPADRRFHAEPLACPACGPRLRWQPHDPSGAVAAPATETSYGDDALRRAEVVIAAGGIVAVKGLGGYQLVCDAGAGDTVALLRARKHRWAKPLAVMVADVTMAHAVAVLDPTSTALLTSPARPIVLATARTASPYRIAAGVHPGTDRIGVFLPYSPLHHLLLGDLARPLVVTSGNRSDEPMVTDDDAARAVLGPLVDGFLDSDRPIAVRYDDSVVQVTAGHALTIRRARGYAPAPLRLPVATPAPLVAVGAELKHTFCLADGTRAVLGPHTGDLEDAGCFDEFLRTFAHMARLGGMRPRLVAHDLHPGYLSTQHAMTWSALSRVPVQHHHAHVAAVAAEHGITERFLGVAYDGLGMGDDGTLWGGEVLVATLASYRRFARFARAPLPGGAAAVRRPARMALGYLYGAEAFDGAEQLPAVADTTLAGRLETREIDTVRLMVERGLNAPAASSAGRLFDTVAALLGLRDDAAYEGEAAVALEHAASGAPQEARPLRWALRRAGDLLVYDVRPTLADVVAASEPVAVTAARFHATLVDVTLALCDEARRVTGLSTVCLGGGVFQNRRLTGDLLHALAAGGFTPYVGNAVPVNDGGISYGQAAVAAARTGRR